MRWLYAGHCAAFPSLPLISFIKILPWKQLFIQDYLPVGGTFVRAVAAHNEKICCCRTEDKCDSCDTEKQLAADFVEVTNVVLFQSVCCHSYNKHLSSLLTFHSCPGCPSTQKHRSQTLRRHSHTVIHLPLATVLVPDPLSLFHLSLLSLRHSLDRKLLFS